MESDVVKTVLVVDDSVTVRKLLGYVLKQNRLNLLEAPDGLRALEVMGTNAVDLLITDLNMPNMDGIELTRTVRSDPAYKDIPIIMVTTQSDELDRQMGYDAGVNLYLVKPIIPQALIYKVTSLLGGAS